MPVTDPRVVSVTEPVIIDLHSRMGRLEDTVAKASQESAKRDTQIAMMKNDVTTIKDGQDKIFSGISRLLWVLFLGFGGSFVTFITTGGYVVIQQ